MKFRQGSISVFLALILIPVLILVMTLSESVRCHGLKVNVLEAGYAASDSVFAGFDRSVFEKYGLLFYDGGFGLGLTQYELIEEEYQHYFDRNVSQAGFLLGGSFFSVRASNAYITDIIHATDYQGMVFVTSALDYYKFDKAGDVLSDILEKLGLIQTGEKAKEQADAGNSADVIQVIRAEEQMKQAGFPSLETLKNRGAEEGTAALPERPGVLLKPGKEMGPGASLMGEEGPSPEEDYSDILSSGIIGQSNDVRTRGWLSLAMPKNRTMSGYQVVQKDFPSLTAVDERDDVNGNIFTDLLKKVAFDEYLLDHFTCFMDEQERNGLQYELEYILFGEDRDDENLRKALNRMLLIREGMNLLTLASSERLKAEARALAVLMIGWTGIEPLVELLAVLLEGAWCHAESISDMKALLSGERVPLLKNEAQWHLSLSDVGGFFSGDGAPERTSSEGMNYKDYLRILLYLSNFQNTSYRTMDMVQHNEQKTGRNFLMASEIYAMEFRVHVWAGQIFTGLPFIRNQLGLGSDYFFTYYYSGAY